MHALVRLAALGFAALVLTAADPVATPQTLVDLELRFAADAHRFGTRAAFMKHLSEGGVIFSPGPVNARLTWEARTPQPGVLAWTPQFAELSGGGDMGWTTGPWAFHRDSVAKDPVAWGQYLTVWRHTEREGWKAVIDGGVSHDRVSLLGVLPNVRALPPGLPKGKGPLAERQGLWKADEEFGRLARTEGVGAAMRKLGAADVRVLREGAMPMGGPVAVDSVSAREGTATLSSNAQFISEAADLGYTYGTLVASPADTSWYIHVWRRTPPKGWELAAQVKMPVPGR